jgi:hypothetical protein
MSLFRPRSVHSPAHQSYIFIGHRFTLLYIVRLHTGGGGDVADISAILVFLASPSGLLQDSQ